MSASTKLEQIRDLVKTKMLEIPSFSGEEMNLPQSDPSRDAFLEGERTVAAQVLALLDEPDAEEAPRHREDLAHASAETLATIEG